METVIGTVFVLCWGIMAAGGIWMFVKVFQDSVKRGFCWLFIPLYFLFYLSGHWNEMKKPFWVWLGGAVGYVVSALLWGFTGGF